MRKLSKMLSIMLVMALCVSLAFTGCTSKDASKPADTSAQSSSSTAGTSESAAPTAEPLEKVNLVGYLLGTKPTDGPKVMAEINKKMETDINATIDLRYIDFADVATKYPLILSAGEDVDFLFGNVSYTQNAAKGAYAQIKMEDVQKYMPLTFKATPEDAWTDALVDGKIYMIPQAFDEIQTSGIYYREDLREKYNVPEIKTLDDIVPFLEAVKKNDTKVLPYQGQELFAICGYYLNEKYGIGENLADNVVGYDLDDSSYKLYTYFDADYEKGFKAAAAWMKGLQDKGLVPKNALASKSNEVDLFKNGKIAMRTGMLEGYPGIYSDIAASGTMKLGFLPVMTPKGSTSARPHIGNGVAFASSSKNLQRAMMALDLVCQEKSYNWLAAFGIEGTNYIINAEGKHEVAPGIDKAKNPYSLHAAGWWFINRDIWPAMSTENKEYLDKKAELKTKVKANMLKSFNPNLDSVKTEVANIANVKGQFEKPMQVGMVKDVDAAYKILQENLKAAGYDRVIAEIEKQKAEFIKSHTK